MLYDDGDTCERIKTEERTVGEVRRLLSEFRRGRTDVDDGGLDFGSDDQPLR